MSGEFWPKVSSDICTCYPLMHNTKQYANGYTC